MGALSADVKKVVKYSDMLKEAAEKSTEPKRASTAYASVSATAFPTEVAEEKRRRGQN